VQENILYGNLKASNMQIKEAVDIANASEIIESQALKSNLTTVQPPFEMRLFLKPTNTGLSKTLEKTNIKNS